MEFSLRIKVLSLLTSKVEKFHEYSKSAQKKKKSSIFKGSNQNKGYTDTECKNTLTTI